MLKPPVQFPQAKRMWELFIVFDPEQLDFYSSCL